MKKIISIKQNNGAITVMYDTILFLTFISLAGAVLLPAFIPSNISSSSEKAIHDNAVDESLHLMLISTSKEFNYTIGSSIIQPFAETMGINTSQTNGLYHTISQWILGKQQFHKTFGEHISEMLYCMLEFPISNNESIKLNFLTSDYETQLKNHISEFLENQLKETYQFHLVSTWKPIKNLEFGGTFEMGETPPKTNCYVANKKISIPFLPIMTAYGEVFVLSEHWFSEKINEYNDEIPILINISNISDNLSRPDITEAEKDKYYTYQNENISSLLLGIIFDGLYNSSHNQLIPGVLSMILKNYLNDFSKKIIDMGSKQIENTTGYAFSKLDSFFLNCDDSITDYFTSYLKDIIIENVTSYFSNITVELTNLSDYLVEVIISILKEQFQPFIESFILSVLPIIQSNLDFNNLIDELISFIFSQLSLSSASVSLTIWEGTYQ
ncbi:MAG: hypothetical protein DRN27_01330 [Thermoplasmata archaeon]|nr:MAG: hypothetical protein DRN27_01330 [Thermoplasmata archaeon]